MSDTPRITGRVKWFNNASGFGFITVCDGEHTGKDIFVHYSSIQVQNEQYKYLVQGEYVDFDVVKPNNGIHEYHADSVSGIKGGALMCETWCENRTRRDFRIENEIEQNVSRKISASKKNKSTSSLNQTQTFQY
jgi:CspA family cold shock protein